MSASETGRLAPYVPRALLARMARQLDVLEALLDELNEVMGL